MFTYKKRYTEAKVCQKISLTFPVLVFVGQERLHITVGCSRKVLKIDIFSFGCKEQE